MCRGCDRVCHYHGLGMSRYVVSRPCHVCNTITEALKYVSVSNFRITCVYIYMYCTDKLYCTGRASLCVYTVCKVPTAPITNDCEVTFVSHSE